MGQPQKKIKKCLHGTTQESFLGISERSWCLQSDGLKIHWFSFIINNFNGFRGPLNLRNNLCYGSQASVSSVSERWAWGRPCSVVWWRRDKRPEKTLPLRLPCRRFIRNRITTTNIFTSKAIINKTPTATLMASCPSGITFFLLLGKTMEVLGGMSNTCGWPGNTSPVNTSLSFNTRLHKVYQLHLAATSRSWKSAKLSKARAVRPRYFTQRPVHVLLASSKNYSCDLDLGAKSGMF